MVFHIASKRYITKLINIQRRISSIYKRMDSKSVNHYSSLLSYLLSNASGDHDRMIDLWKNYRRHIRCLIPSVQYSGFAKLLREYEELDAFVIACSMDNCIFYNSSHSHN